MPLPKDLEVVSIIYIYFFNSYALYSQYLNALYTQYLNATEYIVHCGTDYIVH